MQIKLDSITKENWEYAVGLTTNKNLIPTVYEEYVMSAAYSMLEAIYKEQWTAKAIVLCDADKEKIIGIAMYGPIDLNGKTVYELRRFMIDVRFQGKGYGTRALNAVLEEMKNVYDCDAVYLSVAPKNSRALHIYEKAGFISTGIRSQERIAHGDTL